MTKHYRQHAAGSAFERNASRLRLELSMGTPRRHLDVLVELLRVLVEETGGTQLTARYRAELADLERAVATRSNLRVVR
jgi:hypothetical protein